MNCDWTAIDPIADAVYSGAKEEVMHIRGTQRIACIAQEEVRGFSNPTREPGVADSQHPADIITKRIVLFIMHAGNTGAELTEAIRYSANIAKLPAGVAISKGRVFACITAYSVELRRKSVLPSRSAFVSV